MKKKCIQCGLFFQKVPSNSAKYWKRKIYCSRKCFGLSRKGIPSPQIGFKRSPEAVARMTAANKKRGLLMRGEKAAHWKGGRVNSGTGYIFIYCKDHPRTRKDWPYVFEHILVMENKIGRFLKDGERVHHLNRKKDDNRPENLVLFSSEADHQKWHFKNDAIHGHQKIKKEDVFKIREIWSRGGITKRSIAKMFHITESHVGGIIHGKSWKEL